MGQKTCFFLSKYNVVSTACSVLAYCFNINRNKFVNYNTLKVDVHTLLLFSYDYNILLLNSRCMCTNSQVLYQYIFV